MGTHSRPSGATARAYGCTPVARYLITFFLAASITATPLPELSCSYRDTNTRLPSRETATNRGVFRSATGVTRRDPTSTTDSTCDPWLATYKVLPSGETATPS